MEHSSYKCTLSILIINGPSISWSGKAEAQRYDDRSRRHLGGMRFSGKPASVLDPY